MCEHTANVTCACVIVLDLLWNSLKQNEAQSIYFAVGAGEQNPCNRIISVKLNYVLLQDVMQPTDNFNVQSTMTVISGREVTKTNETCVHSVKCRGFQKCLIIITFWFSVALRPQEPWGLLGTGSQARHLDFHTAPDLCNYNMKRTTNTSSLIIDTH